MKKWIIFDVDDVTCNFRESLHQSLKKIGKDVHWTTWKIYEHIKIYDLDSVKTLHEHMTTHRVLEQALCEPNIKQMMDKLKAKGYFIGFLTARGWHRHGESITQEFIQSNDLPVDKLIISGLYHDKKSSHIKNFDGEIVAFFDDSIHHVHDFIEQGIAAYIVDRPWNQNAQTLPRIDDVAKLAEFFPDLNIKP